MLSLQCHFVAMSQLSIIIYEGLQRCSVRCDARANDLEILILSRTICLLQLRCIKHQQFLSLLTPDASQLPLMNRRIDWGKLGDATTIE